MPTPAPLLPGYRVYEYLLVLHPHEELQHRIQQMKEEFSTNYKASVAKNLKPHIALVRFSAYSLMEEKIVHRLQTIALGIAPFKVELRDYGSYPSHTIFINVTTKLPVQHLVAEVKTVQRLLKLNNETKPHFIDEPRLAVARKLKPWQYESGWLEWSHRQFTGRFIADSMLLLKRLKGELKYQVLKRLEFMNQPITTKQGNLFLWSEKRVLPTFSKPHVSQIDLPAVTYSLGRYDQSNAAFHNRFPTFSKVHTLLICVPSTFSKAHIM